MAGVGINTAEPGAPAAAGGIPLCVPHLAGREWEYIKECLDTNYVSSVGSFVNRFERMVADTVGARYGVATVNGTSAIHIALIVAGVETDDEVIMPTLTFIAPANAVRYAGAWPFFIDAESEYWQIDPGLVEEHLRRNCRVVSGVLRNTRTNRRVKALLPVHILGHPCDMDRLRALSSEFKLALIEDATESLGATYKGHPVGTLSDVGCFSFNGNKLITTGGGGMIVTDDEELARRAKYLTTQAKDDPIEFVHGAVGYNYRLTNIQAALGCAQLEQLETFLRAKRRIFETYREGFARTPGITMMRESPEVTSARWLSTILVDEHVFGMDSRDLMERLAEVDIQSRPLWQPLHRSPAHPDGRATCPVADDIQSHALSLPSSVGLEPKQQTAIINRISALSK
jgi:perosamine synthetase